MGFRKGLLIPQVSISPISSVHITLDAQLAPEDAARGQNDREFRSVLPGHYSINRIRFLAFRRLRVYPRLSPTEPFRSIFPLRDGPNDSLLPSASPETSDHGPVIQFSPTPFPPGGLFVHISYFPSLGYPVGNGSRSFLPRRSSLKNSSNSSGHI